MSFNLVDLVKDHLTDQLMDAIGGAIGGSTSQTQSALGGAIPGLLNSFLNIGGSESGAAALFDAVNKQDDSILDSLANALTGSGQHSLMRSGSDILGSLLGNTGVGTLASAISSFSGINKHSSSSLLGMLTPIILSVIKRKLLGSGGLNVNSLMNMLTGQKQNIQASMPSGFLDSFNTAPRNTSHSSERLTRSPHELEIESHITEKTSIFKKLIPLLLVIAGLFFLYNLLINKSHENEVTNNRASTMTTTKARHPTANPTADIEEHRTAEAASANAIEPSQVEVDVANEIRNSLTTIASGLTNIKDVDSAKQALPAITTAAEKVNELGGIVGSLPAPAKEGIIKLVSSAIPQLQGMAEKATSIPGVADVLKPVLDPLFENLQVFQ